MRGPRITPVTASIALVAAALGFTAWVGSMGDPPDDLPAIAVLLLIIAVAGLGVAIGATWRKPGPTAVESTRRPARIRRSVRSDAGTQPAARATDLGISRKAMAQVGAAQQALAALRSGRGAARIDPAAISTAEAALQKAMRQCAALYVDQRQLEAAHRDLGSALSQARIAPSSDPSWRTSRQAVREARERRQAAVQLLVDQAQRLAAATTAAEVAQANQQAELDAAGRLGSARRAAIAAASAPAAVFPADEQLSELTDAVDGVAARLDAADELDRMTPGLRPARRASAEQTADERPPTEG